MTTLTTPADTTRDPSGRPVWRALHAYCHAGKDATDSLLTGVVGPTVRGLRERGLVDAWFFIRYWQGGPHIRVRLAAADATRLDQACTELAEAMSAHLGEHETDQRLAPAAFYQTFQLDDAGIAELGWSEHGVVREEPYDPELERYGGDEAIGVAEQLFQVSSDVALAVISGTTSDQARVGVALELFVGFSQSLYDEPADCVRWLREYAVMWRYLDTTVAERSAPIRAAAEAAFTADRERLVARRTAVRGDDAPGLCRHWSAAANGVFAWLRDHETDLTVDPDAVMVSQLHMLSNRIGLTAADEVYLVSLAALVISAPPSAYGYFDDGPEAPDRVAHDLSKFRLSVFEEQRPRDGSPLNRALDFVSGDPVPLPEPDQAGLDRPLRQVIESRRSHREGYDGSIALADLGAVVGYAAGFVGRDTSEVDGRVIERGVRAFPSAGMSYPTVVRIAAFDVTGLRPAVYEYLPDAHALQQVGQLPSREALTACSPFFIGDAPRIDVSAAPAVLFLAADITAMRRRYGLRTLRFATLELGHVAQNVALLATALGLPAAPVGGFFDDAAVELAHLDGYDEILGYLVPLGAPRGTSTDDYFDALPDER